MQVDSTRLADAFTHGLDSSIHVLEDLVLIVPLSVSSRITYASSRNITGPHTGSILDGTVYGCCS